MDSQTSAPQNAEPQKQKPEGGAFGDHPMQLNAMAGGTPGASAQPPPFNGGDAPGGGSGDTPIQRNADPGGSGGGGGQGGSGAGNGGNGGGNANVFKGVSSAVAKVAGSIKNATDSIAEGLSKASSAAGGQAGPVEAGSPSGGADGGAAGGLADLTSGEYSRFSGKAIPAVDPRTTMLTLPASEETRITTGLTNLSTNKKQAEDEATKVSDAKAAAEPHSEEPTAREATPKVKAINTVVSSESNLPDTSDTQANNNTSNRINSSDNSPIPGGDPDQWNSDQLTNLRNNVRGEMSPVDIAQSDTEALFDTTLAGQATLPETTALETEIESAPDLATIDLAANPYGDLVAGNADLSGIMGTLEESLTDVDTLQGVIGSDEMSGYHWLVKDDWAALTGEDGPESFSLENLQLIVTYKEAGIKTAVDAAETTRKDNMDVERTEHLGSARTNQESLKTAHKVMWDEMVTTVKGAYDTADTAVSDELGDLKARFDGGSSPKGGNYIGLDATIDLAVEKYKRLVSDDFIADGIMANAQRSANRFKGAFLSELGTIITNFNGYIDGAVTICKSAISTAHTIIDQADTDFTEMNGANGLAVTGYISNIRADLTNLGLGVDTEAGGLRDDLGVKKEETILEIEEWIKSLAWSWMDLVNGILDIFLQGGEAALWLLLKTFGVSNPDAIIAEIKRFASAIGDILKDPGGFASRLVTVVRESFVEYFQNFGANMQEILFTWLFGQPGLEFPSDFSASSWIEFAMTAADINTVEISTPLESAGVGISIDVAGMVGAFLEGGFSDLLTNVQGQLDQMNPLTDSTATTEGDDTGGTMDLDEIKGELKEMNWDSFIALAGPLLGEDTVMKLEKGKEIYIQVRDQQFGALIQDLVDEVGADFNDVPKMIGDTLVAWITSPEFMANLLTQLAVFAAPGGGLGRAIKAIADGIMWLIDNKDRIWDIISGILGLIPMIASGPEGVATAKSQVTTIINQSIGMLLDLFTELIGSSPSKQLGDVVDSMAAKLRNGLNAIMTRISSAVDDFLQAIRKMLGGQHKKRDPDNDEGTPQNQENDYQGNPIPLAGDIVAAINVKQGQVDNEAPVELTNDINYGTSYGNRKKTYKVLQALLDLYGRDNSYMEDGTMTREKAVELAGIIKQRHRPLFKEFRVKDDGEVDGGPNFAPPGGEDFWAWEWEASPVENAPAGKKFKAAEEEEEEGHEDDLYEERDRGPAPESYIDPMEDINPDEIDEYTLRLIMQLWVVEKLGICGIQDFGMRYDEWYEQRGAVTRSRFREIFSGGRYTGEGEVPELVEEEGGDAMQMARTPNTDSYQKDYTGKNGFNYKDVVYRRDGDANINFASAKSSTSWTNPQSAGSNVQLNTGSTHSRWGIMPSGKKVEIPKASRSQHFAIGDRLYPQHNRKGKLTWHHLTSPYIMVLVDMTVHAKHGHNGGVYLWT